MAQLKSGTTVGGDFTVDTDKLVVEGATGKVGIGTSSPASTQGFGHLLEISDGDSGTSKDSALVLSSWNSSSAENKWEIGNDTGGKLQFIHSVAGDDSTGIKMLIDSSGNVGIGTSSPAQKLEVKETSTASGTYFPITVGGSNHVAGYSAGIGFDPEGYGNRNKMAIVAEGISAGWSRGKLHFLINAANNSAEATLSDSKMVIQDNGNVGIGTDSPSAKLDIKGNTTTWDGMAKIYLTDSNTNASSRNWSIGNGGSAFGDLSFIVSNTKDGEPESASGTVAMTIANAGDVTVSTGNLVIGTSGKGIDFSATANTTATGASMASELLDDYEEGTLNWKLQRSDQVAGSNHADTKVKYTKIGNKVFISGYVYTASTGNTTGVYARLLNTSDDTAATLPFVPNHHGVLHVGHTRTMSHNEETSISFKSGSSTVYVYQNDSTGDYIPDNNRVPISNAQTHLVITFQGVYTTDS